MESESTIATDGGTDPVENPGRRKFLGTIGKAGIGAAVVASAPALDPRAKVAAQNPWAVKSFYKQRAVAAYQYRVNCALTNFQSQPPPFARTGNGDEVLYPNRIGSYSKGLLHKPDGEVEPAAYATLLRALGSGRLDDYESILLGGDARLTNPQAGLAFELEGKDPFSYVMNPAPTFASREIAAEIAENYWMALLRDVPFSEYLSNPAAAMAAADLSLFGADFKGPKGTSGSVTPRVLFRGLTPGDQVGPYVSQFFYLPCRFGANEISQKIRTVLGFGDGGRDYMTDFDSWLAIQNGAIPSQSELFDPTPRYIRNGRDLSEWVHMDVLFQAYFQAFLIITGLGVPVDAGNPYRDSSTQVGFGTFGDPHIAGLLCEVSTRALKAVWNQKWFVHRRIRPEAFAERVDRAAFSGANYSVHPDILNSVTSSERLGGYLPPGNAFLPMAFPEGCPTHPSYGAGHATVAGACVTILKAWFDESTVIQQPVEPDPSGITLFAYNGTDTMTVGGELNKLASNVALGRNIAGVHWRSDATDSLKLGEAVAISVLKDQKLGYHEAFGGFSLTKFDGTTITV